MKRIEHREEKWPFAFVEYSPETMTKGLPIIIQLHGAGERGDGKDDLALVDVHGFSKLLKKKDFPAIFIMPQCPTESFWAARVESIVRFVEMLTEEYRADKSRIYLTGLSMGGFGTWFTSMARPDLFAAIAPVCGGGMAWNVGVLDMPVWAFHGEDDPVVLCVESKNMVKAINDAGGQAKLTILPKVQHNCWDYAYSQKQTYDFLFANAKK